MWLLVGLGNPGKRYAGNRHNVGFMVIDELARRHNIGAFRSNAGGDQSSGLVAGERAVLLKPMKYMNLSGHPVSHAVQYLNVDPAENLVVIHDEADLPHARLRLKSGGGHGGHNGLRSIMEQLGGGDFLRVRVGVGKPEGVGGAGAGDKRVANYLLADFASGDRQSVDEMVGRAADATEAILKEGIRAAMNQFNGGGSADKA